MQFAEGIERGIIALTDMLRTVFRHRSIHSIYNGITVTLGKGFINITALLYEVLIKWII